MVKTNRQVKVVKKTIENLSSKKPINKQKILESVGYSENTAKTPEIVYGTKYVKKELNSFIKQLEEKRQMAIDAITKGKLTSSKAKDLAGIIDTLTKNIQLLSGEATEKTALVLDNDLKKSIAKELLDRG